LNTDKFKKKKKKVHILKEKTMRNQKALGLHRSPYARETLNPTFDHTYDTNELEFTLF
jgi:hypothetical protein